MKHKKGKVFLAGIALLAMVAMTAPTTLAEDRGPMSAEDDFFWDVFAQMTTPEDYSGCVTALNNYINSHPDEFGGDASQVLAQMTEMCTQVGLMRTDMQTNMTAEGVQTSLFDAGNTNWHAISGLYFQKTENGAPMGRISFSNTIDFMSYRFFTFMNNFGNLVQFNDGYISLNAAMVPNMIDYGASLTMYGLDFDEIPDIYVSNGTTMRRAIEGTDVSGISYDASAGTLTFTPGHFSSFKVVEKGSTLETMQITKVDPRSRKYNANKSTFKVNVKGRNLYKAGTDTACTLGFSEATKVSAKKNGKRVRCTFSMSEFSTLGYYPMTISIIGTGEVTKTNAVRIK
jgi:hypothetical protein